MKFKSRGFSTVAMLASLGVVLVLVLSIVTSYVGAANFGNATEMRLKAKVENNENIYAQGTQKIIEIAQVPQMYVDDITKVTAAAIGGRYGADGSKAVFQMLKEQNPQLDASMYKKIQQVIESFRDEFKNSQTEMLDIRRSYETALGTVWQGLWLRTAGYPKLDLSKYVIVSTDTAATAFKTHRDTGIVLRPVQK